MPQTKLTPQDTPFDEPIALTTSVTAQQAAAAKAASSSKTGVDQKPTKHVQDTVKQFNAPKEKK